MTTLFILSEDDFDDTDNTYIRTTPNPALFPDFASTIVEADSSFLAGAGDDTIVAAGFVRLNKGTGLNVGLHHVGGLFDMGDDDDTILALIEVERGPETSFGQIIGVGLRSTVSDSFFLGDGNNTLVGAALLRDMFFATAVGINAVDIVSGDGDDIIAGLGALVGSGESRLFLDAAGLSIFGDLRTGTGSDIVVGAGLNSGNTGAEVEVYGITGAGSDFPAHIDTSLGLVGHDSASADAPPVDGGDIVAGVGLIVDSAFTEGSGIAEGIHKTSIATGEGDDIVFGAGVILADAGGFSLTARGISDSQDGIDTGADADTVIGVAQIVSPTTASAGVIGIQLMSITVGDGENVVLGIGTFDAGGGDPGAVVKSKFSSAYGLEFVQITAGDDDDLIAGIGSVIAQTGAFINSSGIRASTIVAGGGNDIVIGLADGAFYTEGGEVSERSFGFVLSTIILGEGDDFVFARGSDSATFDIVGGGMLISELMGDAGNDVFDILRGSGRIDGGADFDTLVLGDAFGAYDIELNEVDTASGASADTELGFLLTQTEAQLSLRVDGVERFVFDGVVYTAAELEAYVLSA